jgi:hypothetical protein
MKTHHPNLLNPVRVPRTPAVEYAARQAKVRSTIHKDPATFQAGVMALFGMGVKAIAAKTGLRAHQVTYRLHRTHVRISDYRQGQGPVAEFILEKARPFAMREFQERLSEALNLQSHA